MSFATLLLASAAAINAGFGLASAFVVPITLLRGVTVAKRAHSTAPLYSTTESDVNNKASPSDENNHDRDGNDGNFHRDILTDLDKFASELSGNDKDNNDKDEVMKELDIDLSDEDFVLVGGGRAAMERDDALTMVSSEVSIWTNLRKKSLTPKKGLPIDVILQRTWDTVEDVWAHLRRIPFEKGWTELSDEAEATRKTVVVLGSGWASHALSKVADCQKIRLIVVSPSNHFVFTPMLASAAVGTVEYRSMTEAVRSSNPMIDQYIEGAAVHVDVNKKYVDVKLNSLLDGLREGDPPMVRVDYDHLVVSVGSRVDDRGVPGAEKALRLKSCEDARRLRTAVGECFEYASRPDCRGSSPQDVEERSRRVTFLIVGG